MVDVVSDEDLASRALAEAGEAELGRSVLRDTELLDSLAEAGFYGVTVLRRDTDPWKLAGAVELRRLAAVGYKGKEGPCFEHFQAVMYRGPFKEVHDDEATSTRAGGRLRSAERPSNSRASPIAASSDTRSR